MLEEILSLEETKKEIKKKFLRKTGGINSCIYRWGLIDRPNFSIIKKSIIFYTSFLNEDVSFNERIYCILNNITTAIKCRNEKCNNNASFRYFSYGYNFYCSAECERIQWKKNSHSEETNKKRKRSLNNRSQEKKEDANKKISNSLKGRKRENFCKDHRKKIGESKKGRLGINNGLVNKFVYANELDKYYEQGYIFGHLPLSEERIESIRISSTGRKQSQEERDKRANKLKGHKAWNKGLTKDTDERIKKYGDKVSKKRKGKKHTEEHNKNVSKAHSRPDSRKKNRLRAINRIEDNFGICWPNYNKSACNFFAYFDNYFKLNYLKSRYAMYGFGEYHIRKLGYFLDYINFEEKIIIEFDEEHHFIENDNLSERDILRQKEIQDYFPRYKFIRIREKDFLNNFKELDYDRIIKYITSFI
jgi:hypothetical protein